MQEYYFLFGLALTWTVFAVVQDLRTREVSNWLNFSFIAFALAYRAFYSAIYERAEFFLFGLGGVLLFIALGYLFYYARVFAGGDAKLLMGLGGVLPIESVKDYVFIGGGFIFALLLMGAAYGLCYSMFLAFGNWSKFSSSFKRELGLRRGIFNAYFGVMLALAVISVVLFRGAAGIYFSIFFLVAGFFALVYVFGKAIENSVMRKLVLPIDLREGDWIEGDIVLKINGKRHVIKKSMHGLTLEDIRILKRAGGNRRILIKEGIPFTPAFLLALLVFFYLWSGFAFSRMPFGSLL